MHDIYNTYNRQYATYSQQHNGQAKFSYMLLLTAWSTLGMTIIVFAREILVFLLPLSQSVPAHILWSILCHHHLLFRYFLESHIFYQFEQ